MSTAPEEVYHQPSARLCDLSHHDLLNAASLACSASSSGNSSIVRKGKSRGKLRPRRCRSGLALLISVEVVEMVLRSEEELATRLGTDLVLNKEIELVTRSAPVAKSNALPSDLVEKRDVLSRVCSPTSYFNKLDCDNLEGVLLL